MGYLKERIKHAVRFRHKRGYGVHSPFMFNLILNVIRDKEKQFTYPQALEEANSLSRRERKIFRLLSRLIRHFKVEKVACIGYDAELLTGYLPEVYGNASIACNRPECLEQSDFIYLGRGLEVYLTGECIFSTFPETVRKYIVIADICKNTLNRRIWRCYRDKATVSVDMMWYGLLLFDNRIQRGKYSLTI